MLIVRILGFEGEISLPILPSIDPTILPTFEIPLLPLLSLDEQLNDPTYDPRFQPSFEPTCKNSGKGKGGKCKGMTRE
jgi:hypothetical protein